MKEDCSVWHFILILKTTVNFISTTQLPQDPEDLNLVFHGITLQRFPNSKFPIPIPTKQTCHQKELYSGLIIPNLIIMVVPLYLALMTVTSIFQLVTEVQQMIQEQ